MKKLVLLLSVLSMSALAQMGNGNPPPPRGNHPPPSAEMKVAFEACKELGRPGETAFDNCMQSKGFKKPEGHQHGERPMGPPPSTNTTK